MDEVVAEARVQGPRCGLRKFLDTQPKADALEFLRIIRSDEAPASAIWRALAKRGFALGLKRIDVHRAGACKACYPPKKGKA